MAHSVIRLFMDDLRHWNILDTIFICFQMGMCIQKYVFVSKGQM